jgi:hypothetical protein
MTIISELKTVNTLEYFVEKLLNIARISNLSQDFDDFFIGQKVEAREMLPLSLKVNI